MKWQMSEEEEAYLEELPAWLANALDHMASGTSAHLVLAPPTGEQILETKRWYKGVVSRDQRFVERWLSEELEDE